jgi:hypothetical protein
VIVSVPDATQPGEQPPVPLVDIDQIEPDQSLLADVRRTRVTTPFTRVLLVLIVLSVGFLGGALVDRHERPSTNASSSLSSLISRFRGGRGGSGGVGGSGGIPGLNATGAGGATTGTVKLVDGTTVYIQDAAGDEIKVTTSPNTNVTITKAGTVAQLAVGNTISVQGTASGDGTSIAATSIAPGTSRGGFGGGGFGGAANATGG